MTEHRWWFINITTIILTRSQARLLPNNVFVLCLCLNTKHSVSACLIQFDLFFFQTFPESWSDTGPPALPIDVLQLDWWVPGSSARAECQRYQGKPLFKEILSSTLEATKLWMSRAIEDWVLNINMFSCLYVSTTTRLTFYPRSLYLDLAHLIYTDPWYWKYRHKESRRSAFQQDFKRKAPPDSSTKTKDQSWQMLVSMVLRLKTLYILLKSWEEFNL